MPPLPPPPTTATLLRTGRPQAGEAGRLVAQRDPLSWVIPSRDPPPEEPSSEPTLPVEAWPEARDSRSLSQPQARSPVPALEPKGLASC